MIVIDASMTIAWVLDDETSAAAEACLRRVAVDGAHVPSLWRLEVANVLQNAVRRGRCTQDHADRSLARLASLMIAVDPETYEHAWGPSLTLARAENLTIYDAAYLELAIRKRTALASFDADLIAAARRRGVDTTDDGAPQSIGR